MVRRLFLSLLALILGFTSLMTGRTLLDEVQERQATMQRIPVSDPLREQFAKLEAQLLALQKEAAEPRNDPDAPRDDEPLADKLSELEKRLLRLESAISQDPERALSVPLIRRDLDALTSYFDEYRVANEQAVRANQEALHSLVMQLLVGAGALVVAGLTGVVGWLTSKKSAGTSTAN